MLGFIFLWSGSVGSIPPGWQICDGTNGTPNLKNRLIVGAGDSYAPDDSGGSILHTHTFTGDGHLHSPTFPGSDLLLISEPYKKFAQVDINQSDGTTDNGNVLPPYHALAWIAWMGL